MEPRPTRDVHRSPMSALHRTGATATELLNAAASLRWSAAWKSSVSGPRQREKKRPDETWWDAYWPSVTVPPRSHGGGIRFPGIHTRGHNYPKTHNAKMHSHTCYTELIPEMWANVRSHHPREYKGNQHVTQPGALMGRGRQTGREIY